MTERDKPLAFHWRAVDEAWIDGLNLPKPRSRNHDAARRAILVDAALAGIVDPDRWTSYSRRHDWWSAEAFVGAYKVQLTPGMGLISGF